MCHVLIIEDEPMIAMAIEMMVEEEGATSWDVAVTQDEAIAAALAHPPDIITSDVRLIAGTGPLAVAEIAARLGKRPVIYVTGNPEGCTPCAPSSVVLIKPVSGPLFRQAFREAVAMPL
jgi:CheY-like chemotaxis protein